MSPYFVSQHNGAWVLCSTDFQIGDKVFHSWGMTGEIAEQPNKAIREKFIIKVDDGTVTSGYLGGWYRLKGVIHISPEDVLRNFRTIPANRISFDSDMPFDLETPRNYDHLNVKIIIK